MSEYHEELGVCDLADLVEYGDTHQLTSSAQSIRSARPHQLEGELIGRCSLQPQNDTGNGQRLLAYFAGTLLNVREAESTRAAGWHRWTETHWTLNAGVEAAMLAAQKTAERIALEADCLAALPHEQHAIDAAEDAMLTLAPLAQKDQPSAAEKREIARLKFIVRQGEEARTAWVARQVKRRSFAVSSGNDSRIRAMLSQATPHRTISQCELDRDPYAFNVANGTLRFHREEVVDQECPDPDLVRTRQLWTVRLDLHNPTDLISKLAPVNYNPKATAPKFLGSLITGLHGEQCLVFHGGGGSNWKSTFTEIVFRVIGDYGAMLKFESLAGDGTTTGSQASPDIARLPGARLVRASEPDRGVPLKEGSY